MNFWSELPAQMFKLQEGLWLQQHQEVVQTSQVTKYTVDPRND